MADVGEPCFLDIQALRYFNGFRQTDVRIVLLFAQGLNDEIFNTLELLETLVGDVIEVGDVCEVADTEGVAQHVKMSQRNGLDG